MLDNADADTAGRRGTPSQGRPYAVVRALLRPLWRTLPRRALTAGAALGLLFTGTPRLFSAQPDEWLCLTLLRAAALAFALGLAFLLDDPARHLTAAVPTRRPVRTALRVVLVAPLAVLWWTVALFLIPGRTRPPVGAVTLEAAALAVLALAAAASVVRFTDRPEPGGAVCRGLLATTVVALLLPGRWALFVAPTDPDWGASHERWALILVAAALIGAWSCVEPLRTWRPAVRARR